METHAERDGDEWVINGAKTWNTGIHKAKYDLIFARTDGKAGDGKGITAFLTPTDSEGFKIEEMMWTLICPLIMAVFPERCSRAAFSHLWR